MPRRLMPLIWMLGLAASLCLVTGCGEDEDDLKAPELLAPFQITATVPFDGQFSVPLSSKMLIHFPQELDDSSVTGKVSITDDSGQDVEFSIEVQRQSIIISPRGIWKPRNEYTVMVAAGIGSNLNHITTQERAIHFTTGVRRPKASEDLSVVRVDPGPEDPCWDFHTFRIYFNEPINRCSLEYGQSVRFSKKGSDELISGNLFGRGNQIVFDPDEDLEPDATYQMTITTDLHDYQDTGLGADYIVDFTPRSTGERVHLAMEKCPTIVDGQCFYGAVSEDELPLSKFINRNLNSMFADSIILGATNIRVGSRLWNEFADPKISPERIPFVVRKGQKLISPGIASLAGGAIPTGVNSGQVTITVLTDTVGEMIGSEYIHGVAGLPSVIKLTMDSSFAMEDGTAVAIIGQPVLGSTLTGHATVSRIENTVDYETLHLEVVGFSEIEMINEYVPVTMTLRMVPPPTMPEREYDTTPPTLISVSPADMTVSPEDISEGLITRMAEDDIIVVFDEPIDPDGISEQIIVEGPDGRVDGEYELYTPRVIFHPDGPLEPNAEYKVTIGTGITDISGNHFEKEQRIYFTTMPRQSSAVDPPLLNAQVPGLYQNARLPANFFPELYFSQIMDKDSLVYGDTFGVYDVTDGGRELLSATPIHHGLFVRIAPDDQLIPGRQYVMEVTEGVANLDGLALDTDVDRQPGGPDILIPFSAVAYSKAIQSVFITYPYADADVDGYINDGEYPIETNYMEMDFPLISERSYMMGYMPITIYPVTTNAKGDSIIPIDIEPSSTLYATSVSMSLSKVGGPALLAMGRVSIDLNFPSSSDIYLADDQLAGVDTDTTMKFNLENQLLNKIVAHDAYFKIPSALRFSKDGRMMVLIKGMTEIAMTIPGLDPIIIPVFTNMTTSTPPSRRGF
jgi:Bacterial Ig-like domain